MDRLSATLKALEVAQRKLDHWEHGVATEQDCPYKVERDEAQGKLATIGNYAMSTNPPLWPVLDLLRSNEAGLL